MAILLSYDAVKGFSHQLFRKKPRESSAHALLPTRQLLEFNVVGKFETQKLVDIIELSWLTMIYKPSHMRAHELQRIVDRKKKYLGNEI
jgi:hypothetical protein